METYISQNISRNKGMAFQKTCFRYLLKKLSCCGKKPIKITCHEEKSQPPPPRISNGPYCQILQKVCTFI